MKSNTKNLVFAVLATDVALFTVKDRQLLVRVCRVDRPPHFRGIPGLPGGLVSPTETSDESTQRVVRERAHISPTKIYLEQFHTFSGVDRDPRGRVVSIGYIGAVPWESLSATEQKNTETIWWMPAHSTQKMAYDHNKMLSAAIRQLRNRIMHSTISSKLVPSEFTLTDLEQTCEVVLNTEIDKRNFRKKILKQEIVKKIDRKRSGVKHRPPNLYCFSSKSVKEASVL